MSQRTRIDQKAMAARAALGASDLPRARSLAAGLADRAEAQFILGLADAQEGQVSAGLARLDAAIGEQPRPEYFAQKARLLIQLRRDGEALAAAQAAEALGLDDALSFDTVGNIHARLGDHPAALACFERAVRLDGQSQAMRYNLAMALGFVGRVADAQQQHEIMLLRAPADGRVHYALSGLRKASRADNHIDRLETVLARQPAPDDALRIRYALAKEYEDIGEPAKAFGHLAAANAAHKARIGYDFASDQAIFDALEAGFARPEFFTGASTRSDTPIFITGMPRTGTTLVDRILSAHDGVESAGELQAMPLAIKQLAGTRSRLIIDPQTVASSQAIDPDAAGQLYMARASQHHRRTAGRFIDKLPANFLYIGYIARALPRASIICLRRDPMDTVWSNYKNLFASTSAYYFYSYDLLDTARYFARFDRLMELWDRLFPGRILHLSYEQLVAHQEQESRRLYAHCGLDWTDAALDFHRQPGAVATPSAAQVRRPLYSDSVARWRAHADAMAPVLDFFRDQGLFSDQAS